MDFSTFTDDPTALFATLAIIGSIVVFIVLVIRVSRLINTTHSED